MSRNFRATSLSGVALALLYTVPLHAQVRSDPVPAPAAADTATATATSPAASDPQSGDIIVTAQRRSESLQRTPVAVSVLSADTLQRQNIVTELDLQIASPGLTVRASQNSNQLNYAIRGQSLDAFSNTRPGVLPYVNEVQIGGGGGSTAFYDLQSIQVLKGPQGTLFGRNATGGAVLFTTAKPQDDFGGYVSARGGTYSTAQFEGALNTPLVADKVLLRLAGFYERRDGYQYDVFKNERAGNVDRFGLRGSLTIKFSDRLKNDLVVDYLHSGGNNLNAVVYSLDLPGLVPTLAFTNFGNVPVFESIFGKGSAAAYAAANPKLDPGGIASYIKTQQARGPYQSASDGPNRYVGRNTIISNITSLDVGADTQIRNIFGYTRLDNRIFGDIDGGPYGIDDNGIYGKIDLTRQFSDEIQLIGKAIDHKLSYVTGAYFSAERNYDLTGGDLFKFPLIHTIQIFNSETHNTTYAGYAQGTYDLSGLTGIEGLGVTAGARYTSEKVSIEVLPLDVSHSASAAQQALYQFKQSKTYDNVSGTLGIQDQVNSHLLVYVTSRRSYRNGGYNGIVAPIPGLGTNGGDGYGLEKVTDVELGTKFQGRIGDVPTRFNLAVYNDWIVNAQRVAYTLVGGGPAAVTVNVPKARVRGVEFDGQISPASWLQFGGSVNYTDAKFTDNLVSVSGGTPVEFGTYPDTPEWSGALSTDITVPVGTHLAATFRGDAYAQTHTYFSSTGNLNPGTRIAGYTLANFRVGIEDKAKGWSLAVNLKNAFNRVYYVGGVGTGELFQFNTAVPGEPRTILAEVRYRF